MRISELPRCPLKSEVDSRQSAELKGTVPTTHGLSGNRLLSVPDLKPNQQERVFTTVEGALSAVRVPLGAAVVAHHWAALAGKLRRSTGARPG